MAMKERDEEIGIWGESTSWLEFFNLLTPIFSQTTLVNLKTVIIALISVGRNIRIKLSQAMRTL